MGEGDRNKEGRELEGAEKTRGTCWRETRGLQGRHIMPKGVWKGGEITRGERKRGG